MSQFQAESWVRVVQERAVECLRQLWEIRYAKRGPFTESNLVGVVLPPRIEGSVGIYLPALRTQIELPAEHIAECVSSAVPTSELQGEWQIMRGMVLSKQPELESLTAEVSYTPKKVDFWDASLAEGAGKDSEVGKPTVGSIAEAMRAALADPYVSGMLKAMSDEENFDDDDDEGDWDDDEDAGDYDGEEYARDADAHDEPPVIYPVASPQTSHVASTPALGTPAPADPQRPPAVTDALRVLDNLHAMRLSCTNVAYTMYLNRQRSSDNFGSGTDPLEDADLAFQVRLSPEEESLRKTAANLIERYLNANGGDDDLRIRW